MNIFNIAHLAIFDFTSITHCFLNKYLPSFINLFSAANKLLLFV